MQMQTFIHVLYTQNIRSVNNHKHEKISDFLKQ